MTPPVKAMVMTGPGELTMREIAYPDRPTDGAVVQVLANGICGSDWALFSGEQKRPGGQPAAFPLIPGHEPVARIVEISEQAQQRWNVAAGDRIVIETKARCGSCERCAAGTGACASPLIYSLRGLDDGGGLWGGLAEYMTLVAGSNVFRIPDHISDEDATMFNPMGNAYYWVAEKAAVSPGQRVLVLGAGQRGLCCAAAARECGAGQVIITGLARDKTKLELAPRFGATDQVVVDAGDTIEQVRQLTAGAGVDVVIDTVPMATGPLTDAVELLRTGGRLVLAGVRPADAGHFPIERFRIKQLEMVGVSGTSTEAVRRAVDTIAAGTYPFHLMHTHVYPLSRAADAIRLLGEPDSADTAPIHVIVRGSDDVPAGREQ
ncbi:MAG TPA: zinc-binding dehydrogenase [Pseudonocardia sp.]|jgi:threonine dehydrogenase-like Zn-dependent dehydrogenase